MKYFEIFSIIFFSVLFCLFFELSSKLTASEAAQLKGKEDYNVILIIIDDLRPDHLGCYGYHKQISPAIDRIAKDSCVFENAFSQAGYTIASTTSIFTSLYPSSHGVFFVLKDKFPASVKTMAEVFNLYGYKTAWFSLLKEPHLDMDVGFGRGFQDKVELGTCFEGRDELISWIKNNKSNKFFLAMDPRRVHDFALFSPQGKNKSAHEAYQEIEKPFYYRMISLANAKAYPFDDPKIISEYKELFNGVYCEGKTENIRKLMSAEKRISLENIREGLYTAWINKTESSDPKAWIAAYDDCIQATDKELIRPIEEELKALGLYDKTILIITADHGEGFGEHGIYGHGNTFFDEVYHVPLIIKMPNVKEGKKIKELVQSIDIMPTALEASGIDVPHQAQGKSLVGLILQTNVLPLHKYIFEECLEGKVIRTREWKLFVDNEGRKTLFRISLDPKEVHDVYQQNQSIANKLEAELKLWEYSLPSYKDKEYNFDPEVDKAGQERIRKTGYW